MRLPNVQLILSGMSNMDQISDNVATFEGGKPLTDKQEGVLMEACALFHGQISVPAPPADTAATSARRGWTYPS